MWRVHHLVPEQMFSTDEAPAQGISAVKALALASAEGQKIWTITQNNLDLALSSIELGSEVETEIRNAVNAGKTATTHEAQIVYGDWVGSGYLLIDPETGAGAYKIAGGGNGSLSAVKDAVGNLFSIISAGVTVLNTLEVLAEMGNLFKGVAAVLGPLSIMLNLADAKLSGCGIGASFWIVMFSWFSWVLSLTLLFFPLIGFLMALAINLAIQGVSYLTINGIKKGFCP